MERAPCQLLGIASRCIRLDYLRMSAPLQALNLNSLVSLDALLTECNVTRAARRVGVTQPAMSQTLARLRELFDDPLLVRTGRGLVRTPRAEAMLAPLSEALHSVERAIQLGMRFDPATSTRIFRIAMTDLHLSMILPGVLRTMGEHAPHVRIQAESGASGLIDRIGSGEIDLAVGFLLTSASGLQTETLLTDDYVCLVRRGHPLARRKRLELAEYGKQRHVANTPVGFIPKAFASSTQDFDSVGSIQASLPYLMAVPTIVRNTDLVATVPRRLLEPPIDLEGVVTLEAPRELPPVLHTMWWHPRFERDTAHQWLRAQVRAQVF
jgi:DNA-binding transcriptional LysR family regulator